MVQTETAGRLTAQGPGKTFSTPNVQDFNNNYLKNIKIKKNVKIIILKNY